MEIKKDSRWVNDLLKGEETYNLWRRSSWLFTAHGDLLDTPPVAPMGITCR